VTSSITVIQVLLQETVTIYDKIIIQNLKWKNMDIKQFLQQIKNRIYSLIKLNHAWGSAYTMSIKMTYITLTQLMNNNWNQKWGHA